MGLDLDLVTESRYRAENWLKERVKPNDLVVALSSPTYAPRIHTLGRRYFYFDSRPQNEEKLNKIRPYAAYLVIGEFEMPTFDQPFLEKLLAGEMGYKEAARFSNNFLYPKKTIFSFAAWPIKRSSLISPETVILQTDDTFGKTNQ